MKQPILTVVPSTGHHTLTEAHKLVTSPAVDVVCTDIFDTLVWRKVAEPVDAFELVGHRLAERGQLHPSLDPWSFFHLRRTAEREVRRRFLDQHGQSEVRLSEIYSEFPDWAFNGASRGAAMQAELDVEREIVIPDLDVVELLRASAEAGKTLVAVSDTYLSGDELRSLLIQPGMASLGIHHVFASADHRENKSGKLWDIALGALGVPPERVIHLGDNEHADITAPAERGIRTVFIERRSPELQHLLSSEAGFRGGATRLAVAQEKIARKHGWDAGLTALRAKMEHRAELAATPTALQPFWRVGAQVYGPVLAGFAEWVHERVREAGGTTALCLMREGGFLAELVRAGAGGVAEPAESQPFWVNRDIVTRAAIGNATRDELEPLFFRRTTPLLREVLATLGVAPNDLGQLAAHADTRMDDPITRELALAALTAPGPVRDGIIERSRKLRERVVRYVERECGTDGPIIVVDLGWGATIQQRLAKALEQAGRPRRVVGLYMLTNERAGAAVSAGCEVQGYLGNLGAPAPIVDLIMRTPEIIEQALMPAHGTQLDLDEALEPVLEASGPRSLQDVEAEALRRGALAFQREYLRYVLAMPNKLQPLASSSHNVAPILMRAIAAPTPEEAALFGRWMHDENQGSTRAASMIEGDWHDKVRHLSPDQLAELPMEDIYWPYGLAVRYDPGLGELAAAAEAGLVSWDAAATPLESGVMTIAPSAGVGIEGSPIYAGVPRRNRHGLSFASARLEGGMIQKVAIRLGEKPVLVRIDWLTLRIFEQGVADAREIRLDSPSALNVLRRINVIAAGPNLFLGTNTDPWLEIDVAQFTSRVVFRIDVEIAFAALGAAQTLPDRAPDLGRLVAGEAVKELRARMPGPLRRVLRKLLSR